MDDQYQYPYLDSDVWIGWIKGEVTKDGTDRGRIADHILDLAERGEFRICISSLTLPEVHRLKRGTPLDDAQDNRVLEFFEHSWIDVVDVDREIGEQANRFCRRYGLMPNDAIHLACALRAKCDVLLSWDRDFKGIQHQDIRIEKPRLVGQERLPAIDGVEKIPSSLSITVKEQEGTRE